MTDSPEQFQSVIKRLREELLTIRAGRANPAMVEHVSVTAYNSTLPLVQLASITLSDSRTIVIQPWDKSVLKDIENAIAKAKVGITPLNDGSVIRLVMPQLTEERRREYLKLLHQKLEHARVGIRQVREERLQDLRQAKSDGKISEDDFFARQKELQKDVDAFIEQVNTLGKNKEQELLTV